MNGSSSSSSYPLFLFRNQNLEEGQMSLLYRSSFNHQATEFTDLNHCSSFLASLFTENVESGTDDFRYLGSSTPRILEDDNIMGIFVKQETEDSAVNNDHMDTSYGISDRFDEHATKMIANLNLVRHNSSPPAFFSNQALQNGGFRGESNNLTNHVKLLGDENVAASSNTKYMNFGSSNIFNSDHEDISFSSTLTHRHSLPKTASEMATVLKFQGSPCKLRAKRGFATHPRSIAERVRRTRISERMRKLQKLFPYLDKQANTSDMLDMAVEHIKDLQKQVMNLEESKSKCKC
ncbi:basic helix-loop-helix (bHLH) DNA-binding superfamily protein [Euphorbia peplus]|nr:basic helix-loop-helix (bHLH) DNA-binding superfamily protein [Euphorbia peplus]